MIFQDLQGIIGGVYLEGSPRPKVGPEILGTQRLARCCKTTNINNAQTATRRLVYRQAMLLCVPAILRKQADLQVYLLHLRHI